MMIRVVHLSKKIHGALILNNINLEMEGGDIYGLQGANGSGKTMLMRALCGLIQPTDGRVIIDGKVLGKDQDFPSSVGLLLENPAFLSGYTGKENLMILAKLKGLAENSVDEALLSVGLDPNDSRKYRKYSLGMKQRLGIAGAILGNPDLIILDEPFNALDTNGISMIHNLIHQLKSLNRIIVVACHSASELYSLADQIFVIENGALELSRNEHEKT